MRRVSPWSRTLLGPAQSAAASTLLVVIALLVQEVKVVGTSAAGARPCLNA